MDGLRPRSTTAADVARPPSPAPAVSGAAAILGSDELAQAVARLVWDTLADGVAAHLTPRHDHRQPFTVRRREIVDAIEAATRCPLCQVGGHE